MQTPILSDRIISSRERRQRIPYSDMHIWRLEKAGKFPRRIKLGPSPTGRVGWRLSEIMNWIEERAAEREPTGDEPTGDEPTGGKPTGNESTGDEPTGDEPP